ncbi:MAG: NAD(P)/FAD-dependent oxidoreductase [Bacteroidales bacterium]|nr:NAD(P)/FAD-dependent oxidoreductase [Bacteroidales bacterium]
MDTNIVIIGAGVVGLAIARELSFHYSDIYVIEKNHTFGQETSSRNSEVIHSGIYYPYGSLKAKLCVEGKQELYNYCQANHIPHKKIGKLIVATNQYEETTVIKLYEQGINNGVSDLSILSAAEIHNKEPHIQATLALYSPSTGIIDTTALMKQLETDAINNGVNFVYRNEVVAIQKHNSGYIVSIQCEQQIFQFSARVVINSAGLFSDQIAHISGTFEPHYELHFWKGEYFSVHNGKHKYIRHLIYPVPTPQHVSLGVHATLNIQGRLRLGPNAIFLPNKHIDYSVNINHRNEFYESVSHFLPFIDFNDIEPEQAGIRPKLQKPGDSIRDFIIKNEYEKGYENFINLIGIESPGLTCCLAIAKYVKSLIL